MQSVCWHCIPLYALRINTYCNWLFSISEQHNATSSYHSLVSVDGKGQVWLAEASLHISADFGSPPPPAPANQELMKGNLCHLANVSPCSFIGPGWHSECTALWWKFTDIKHISSSFCRHKDALHIQLVSILKPFLLFVPLSDVLGMKAFNQWTIAAV